MADKGIKIKTMNAYEVEQRFGDGARKPLQELKEQIQEEYSADGGEITDGIPAADAAGAPGAMQDAEVDAAPGDMEDLDESELK